MSLQKLLPVKITCWSGSAYHASPPRPDATTGSPRRNRVTDVVVVVPFWSHEKLHPASRLEPLACGDVVMFSRKTNQTLSCVFHAFVLLN